jgi:hypothetical protein
VVLGVARLEDGKTALRWYDITCQTLGDDLTVKARGVRPDDGRTEGHYTFEVSKDLGVVYHVVFVACSGAPTAGCGG